MSGEARFFLEVELLTTLIDLSKSALSFKSASKAPLGYPGDFWTVPNSRLFALPLIVLNGLILLLWFTGLEPGWPE